MLETILRRDQYVIVAALLAIVALAWGYLFSVHRAPWATTMPADNMGGASDSFVFVFGMWVVMMVGMMTPSAAPLILLHARLVRLAEFGKPLAATGWFATGYLLAWTAFSFLIAIAQVALQDAALLTPMIAFASGFLAGVFFIVAGVYQLSSLKYLCFVRCQVLPLLTQHSSFSKEALTSIGLGFRNGVYCVGCCWALMLLLFVGGVMDLFWIAGLAGLILIEKFLPDQRKWFRRISAALIVAGALLIYRSLFLGLDGLSAFRTFG